MSVDKSLPKVIKVSLDTGDVQVKKIPLGRYAQVIREIKGLGKVIDKIAGTDEVDILNAIPEIVADCWGDLVNVIALATGIEEEALNEEIGLNEGYDLVIAILEVNDFFALIGKVQALPENHQELWKKFDKMRKKNQQKPGSKK